MPVDGHRDLAIYATTLIAEDDTVMAVVCVKAWGNFSVVRILLDPALQILHFNCNTDSNFKHRPSMMECFTNANSELHLFE
jgi:hypothetical protein